MGFFGLKKLRNYVIIFIAIKANSTREVITLQGVTRKQSESFESMMRRFNRKVQQSGTLTIAKKKQYREKEPTKREVREVAIRKRARKDYKTKQALLKGM